MTYSAYLTERVPTHKTTTYLLKRWVAVFSALCVWFLFQPFTTAVLAQEQNTVLLSSECITVADNLIEGRVIVHLKQGKVLEAIQEEGITLNIPSSCLVTSQPTPPTDSPDPTKEEVGPGQLSDKNDQIANNIRSSGVNSDYLTDAQKNVNDKIDSFGVPNNAASNLKRSAETELEKDGGNYAAALMGLMAVGCVIATPGGPLCALLPALFGEFFSGIVTAEEVREAGRIAATILSGKPLSEDHYSLLAKHGAKTWALYTLYERDHDSNDQFEIVTGRPLPSTRQLVLEKVEHQARERTLTCNDIATIVGGHTIALNAEEYAELKRKVLNSGHEIPKDGINSLTHCLERFFVQQ